jgi:hypothetical protein
VLVFQSRTRLSDPAVARMFPVTGSSEQAVKTSSNVVYDHDEPAPVGVAALRAAVNALDAIGLPDHLSAAGRAGQQGRREWSGVPPVKGASCAASS